MVNYIGVGVILSKIWLFYYDKEMLKFNKNKVWRMAIDPINEGTGIYGKNWFVRNINEWGNQYYLIKVIILTSIVETVFVILVHFSINFVASNIFEMFLFITQIIVALFGFGRKLIFSNDDDDDDNCDGLGIKQELRLFTLIMPILLFISYFLLILFDFLNNVYVFYIWAYWLFAYGIIYLYLVGVYPKTAFQMSMKSGLNGTKKNKFEWCTQRCFLRPTTSSNLRRPKGIGGKLQESVQLRATLWSHMKSKLTNEEFEKNATMSSGGRKSRLVVASVSGSYAPPMVCLSGGESSNGSDTPMAKTNVIRSWRDVVSVYHGYEAFINHLCGEYSVENLLFIHEVCRNLFC